MTTEYEDFVPPKPAGFKAGGSGEPRNFPVPKSGPRRARVSLIVDIGLQERGDIYKDSAGNMVKEDAPGAIATAQKDEYQVAVFADLVSDIVDYGGEIGKQPFRLMMNGSFGGVLKGINHAVKTPPTTKNGEWTMHPQNLLTKLAIATGVKEVITTGAINRLLGKQFMADVKVSEKDSGKTDANGDPIIYRNVNSGTPTAVAAIETGEVDDDGNPIEAIPEFAALKMPAKLITFANAKKEDIKFIRANVLKLIKLAKNYAGSNMQKAVEAYEAEQGESDDAPAEKPKAAPKAAAKPAAKKAPVAQDPDDDIPF